MRLGALLLPGDIAEQARRLEGEGFESIWSAQAMGRGFMMPDPFVALSVVAGVTERVELGTGILQLPLYNATDIALKALTLKALSNERFLMGLGAGSTESDYQIHREDFGARFATFDTRLDQLRATLADGSANGGNLGASGAPPLLFGTWGKNVARAAGEFDGWIASGMHRTPEQCASALSGYRAAGGARAIVSTIQVRPDTDLGELGATLTGYAEAGFDDAVVMVVAADMLPAVRALVG
ncbi:MAG: LLM class flavin-dependent oxidoreductase [Pseudomonadota bacterium]